MFPLNLIPKRMLIISKMTNFDNFENEADQALMSSFKVSMDEKEKTSMAILRFFKQQSRKEDF